MSPIKLIEQQSYIDEIHILCKEYDIQNYTINDDLTIDVVGQVLLYNKKLTKIPINFRYVSGTFECSYNQLTSLEGCPISVGGYFRCVNNQLTSLEWCPEYVSGHFGCNDNNLISLNGSTIEVGGNFICGYNQLTSLKDAPTLVGGYFYCDNNPLPDEVLTFYDYPILFKHQDEYGIWNSDGSFNKARYDIFFKDFEAGILN